MRSSQARTRLQPSGPKAIESLNTLPERARLFGRPNIREPIVPFGQSAYVLRYAYSPETGEVVVIRIRHGRELRE